MVRLRPFSTSARESPDAPALICGDRSWTYGELWQRVSSLAAALRNTLSLDRGDRVTVLTHNGPQPIEISLAAGVAETPAIPINYRSTFDELEYIVRDSGAKAVFFGAEFAPTLARTKLLANVHCIQIGGGISVESDAVSYESLFEDHGPPLEPDPASRISSIRYTSGTTGRPKAARRDFDAAQYEALFSTLVEEFGYGENDVHLIGCPLYHSAPPTFSSMSHWVGGAIVVMPFFDARQWLQNVQEHRVRSAFIVPTILRRLLDLGPETISRYDTSSLRNVVIAAAKCPARLKIEATRAFGDVFYEFFGSTESSVNTIAKPVDFARNPESCGVAFLGNEIKILDDDGHPCARGAAGEICVRNGSLITEYENAPEKTREAFTADGFYRTGDVGHVDDEGFYYIVDRKKDMIISGGVNIYPAEIEAVFREHPAVKDVGVVGIPDEHWGESIQAVLVIDAENGCDEESLRAFAKAHLADYKRPRVYRFLEQLPYTPEGKLRKRDLRQPALAVQSAGEASVSGQRAVLKE